MGPVGTASLEPEPAGRKRGLTEKIERRYAVAEAALSRRTDALDALHVSPYDELREAGRRVRMRVLARSGRTEEGLALAREIYLRTQASSEQYVDEHFECQDGELPEPDPSFFERFKNRG